MTDPTPQEFELTAELDRVITSAAALLRSARHGLALTGAGLSVESGIPPFRGPGGLWTKYGEPPMDGYQRFLADPRRDWQERLSPKQGWARGLFEVLSKARPNGGHRALAELERRGVLACLITQNVDDLHRQAGSRALLEIHGNHFRLRCIRCVARFAQGELEIDPERLPPLCPSCGGVVKSDTVSFGEPIPPDVLRRCYEEVRQADCMLVAGTSATVYPAAEFPLEVLRRGGALIEVNPDETELTPLATLSLRGPGAAVLERMLHHLAPEPAQEPAP
jgi:NAD-dependent deacetylase